jgi:hypothetical protein
VIRAMMERQGEGIGIERMCVLAGISRAGYYRHWRASKPRQEETALRDAIQRLSLDHRKNGYRHNGYRPITVLLQRAGRAVNHKRVARIRREDNLLCVPNFPRAAITVDWFHVVQIFTTAVEQVRRAEAHRCALPKGVRWATLKRPEALTEAQRQALEELETGGFATAEAYRAKELLRWVRQADTTQAARWRLTHFLRHIDDRLATADSILDPVREAVETVRRHATGIIRRWLSVYSNARLEALNGLFQAARARARGYRSAATFACIIYLIGAPIEELLGVFRST